MASVRLNRWAIRGLLTVLLAAVYADALALDPSVQLTQYVLDNWQIPDGLPQSSAQALARTADGYLWVGTQEGLARFDGVRFTVFDSAGEPAIPNKHISVLLGDRAGRLWIGTRCGSCRPRGWQISRLQCRAWARTRLHSRHHRRGLGAAVGRNGNWIVRNRRGQHPAFFDAAAGLRDVRVRALLEDHSGSLWVGSVGGLQRFDGKQFETIAAGERTPRGAGDGASRRCGWEPVDRDGDGSTVPSRGQSSLGSGRSRADWAPACAP